MQLFYQPELDQTHTNCLFPAAESLHLAKVLRKKSGDVVQVTNGKGYLFDVQLTHINPKQSVGEIVRTHFEAPDAFHLHLAVAPTKSMDRFEWFLEKATEIGIHEITPIICENSERKVIKIERLQKILQAAMKQSLRSYLPQLNEPVSLSTLLENVQASQRFIAYCGDAGQKPLTGLVKPKTAVLLLIGPEGDFSEKEIDMATHHNFDAVTFGEKRLRTETAALVGCHIVNLANLSA
ncbi:MAG: 16S rRNA (uracil(1498)-N(3))-methyltransferase [Flavobacteriaceae bacterium]|nr:16S rRNA (uracil(1498)-N(3))-methyltransferase [Flavobacteriaceae bacterium]